MTVFCTESYENINNVLKQEKKNGVKELLPSFKKACFYIKVLPYPCITRIIQNFVMERKRRFLGNGHF